MPLNFDSVKSSLYQWAALVVPVGMPVIYYQPNAPRPKIPYVSLYLTSIVAVNQDFTSSHADLSGDVYMKGDRNFTLQIQAYGNDPLTVLENMRISLQKQSILDTLRANGIAFYQSLTISDISSLVDSQFEKRAQMDVLFGIGQTYSDQTGYFEDIEIDETFMDAETAIVYSELITIIGP